MQDKACCVTGHRSIPADKTAFVKERLREEIVMAIADGYTVFITGMAKGVDLLFAELVIEQKAKQPKLRMEAAIPYQGRLKTSDLVFRKCIEKCDRIHVQQEKYAKGCFMRRNRYMVDASDRIIAVYDGRESGGTLFTMRYARAMGKEVREIHI